MFGSFLPSLWSSSNRSLLEFKEPTSLCNHSKFKFRLASVATEVLGASGRTMLEAIAAGEDDPEKLAQMARKGIALVAVIALSQVGKSLRGSGNVNNPLETKSK